MITVRTTALLAALSMLSMAAYAAPAAFAVNSAAQGDVTFQENHAKIKQDADAKSFNIVGGDGIGNSGGNSAVSGNLQTAIVVQLNDNPHFNALAQSNICTLAAGAAAIGC
jgi:hypothetical protein